MSDVFKLGTEKKLVFLFLKNAFFFLKHLFGANCEKLARPQNSTLGKFFVSTIISYFDNKCSNMLIAKFVKPSFYQISGVTLNVNNLRYVVTCNNCNNCYTFKITPEIW